MRVPCVAPWHAILVKWHGGVFPDSQFQGGYGNLKNHTLAELWQSPQAKSLRQSMVQGDIPPACSQCSLKEASVGHSRRFFFRDVVEKWIDDLPSNSNDEPDIRYLEINTSNLCNLKCVMCSGAVSTAWIKDERALAEKGVLYSRPEPSRTVWREWDPVWMKNLFAEPRHFQNLRRLSLKGGEPFLDPRNCEILQFFIDQNIASKISLELTTNGTIVDKKMIDLISHFEKVMLYISVEATGDLYRWIRGGDNFSFSDLEKNFIEFRKISNAEIHITTLAMAPNLWNLGELRDWIISLPGISATTFRNVVVNPRYLDPHIIPRDMRISALESYGYSEELKVFEDRRCFDTGFERMIQSLSEETLDEEESKTQRSHFRSFVNDIDQIRGTDLSKLVPELKDLLR